MNPTIKNIAILIEEVASKYDMHIALTGGQLYKDGPRKDIDFVLYHANWSNGSVCKSEATVEVVFKNLLLEGFSNFRNYGRVTKCTYEGIDIDFIYPEYMHAGEYEVDEDGLLDYSFRFPTLPNGNAPRVKRYEAKVTAPPVAPTKIPRLPML